MKAISRVCSILLGLTFIFSGFVKGIDPLGSQYKFTDYFVAFGWDFLVPAAMFLGILLAFAEFFLGLILLLGIKTKIFSWFSLGFVMFFTGLTWHIALTNPVTDCGCFGDALKLSNWQTFYKNIFLLLLASVIAFKRKEISPLLTGKGLLFASLMPALIYVYSAYYSYNHLPIFDFRPFKVGVNIPESMEIPDDAPQDIFSYSFVYRNKKTGEEKQFSEQDYPWQDTLHWEYVSSGEPKLISRGFEPPIHDFFIESPEGDDVSDYFLSDDHLTLILIAHDLEKVNFRNLDRIKDLAQFSLDHKINFIGLTASLSDISKNVIDDNNLPFEFFFCDDIALKTVIRSNPGLLLIKKGTILAKWHHNDIPSVYAFETTWFE